MAIHETKRQSDLEKRLKLLRRQVYGENPNRSDKISESEDRKTRFSITSIHRNTDTLISSDLTYLNQDLLKIAVLSAFAIGTQLMLFFLIQNHLLNLKIF